MGSDRRRVGAGPTVGAPSVIRAPFLYEFRQSTKGGHAMFFRSRLIALALVAVVVLLGAAPAAEACLLEVDWVRYSVCRATKNTTLCE
jgi:hypothetical protein